MKIGTLNVNGFVDNSTKRSLIFKFIRENNLDVICLQETHFNNNDNINQLFIDFKGQYFINSVNKGRKLGVGILFKQGLNVNVIKTINDTEGRTLSLLCQFNDDFFLFFF